MWIWFASSIPIDNCRCQSDDQNKKIWYIDIHRLQSLGRDVLSVMEKQISCNLKAKLGWVSSPVFGRCLFGVDKSTERTKRCRPWTTGSEVRRHPCLVPLPKNFGNGILPFRSTKWSLFIKLFAWMSCKSWDESNEPT